MDKTDSIKRFCVEYEMDEESEILLADGFEDAFIGLGNQYTKPAVAIYDRGKCIEILINRDGMEYHEAVEFFDFNVSGAWVGERTPIYVSMYEDYESMNS